MRGSEFTREGVVAGHWIEKFTSCPGQSRATVIGQAETTLRRADQPGQVGRCAERLVQRGFTAGARFRLYRVHVWRSPGNSLGEQASQDWRVGTKMESGTAASAARTGSCRGLLWKNLCNLLWKNLVQLCVWLGLWHLQGFMRQRSAMWLTRWPAPQGPLWEQAPSSGEDTESNDLS